MSGAYEYKRYMRDGSVKIVHAVTRSRSKKNGNKESSKGSKTKS